jgi:D-alanyl-D-alanine carboxypeptidase
VRFRLTRGVLPQLLGVLVSLFPSTAPLAGTTGHGWPSAGDSRAAPLAALRASAEKLLASGVPGVVVFARRGSETLRIAEGQASLRPHEPLRPTDRFRLGSVTKTYIAAVVLQLVAEQRLRLRDTVQHWLPGLVPGGARITVQELLLHRSGLRDYWGDRRFFAPYRTGHLAYHYTPRQLVRIATSHRPHFAPGTRFAYTNTGYIVLGLIVEAVTGRPLGVELRDRIFRPLHLTSTSFGRGTPRDGRSAHGYILIGRRLRDARAMDLSYDWASGAIVSTAADVADFYRALLTGRLLPRPFVRLMTVTAALQKSWYGFGVMKRGLPCGITWGHAGDTPGFAADVYNSLDGNRQSVTLINVDLAGITRPARRMFFRISRNAYCNLTSRR